MIFIWFVVGGLIGCSLGYLVEVLDSWWEEKH